MKTLFTSRPWDYIPNRNHHKNYPQGGPYEVRDDVYDAAEKAGVIDKDAETKHAGKPAEKPDAGKPAAGQGKPGAEGAANAAGG